MDQTHVHLVLTHFPIVGTLIGAGILAFGLISKNNAINKVALATFISMAILTIPVFITGESAEESVEHLAGVSENLIKDHEALAKNAIWLMGLLGILSLFNLFVIVRNASFAKQITLTTLVISLATFGLFAKVGNLGGQIRHSEIRANNTAFQGNTDNRVQQHYGEEDEHDD